MTSDTVRALERWLAQQPIGDELNEVVVPLVFRDQPCERPVRELATHMPQAVAGPYPAHVQYRDSWHVPQR